MTYVVVLLSNGTLSVAGLMGKGYTCLVSRSLDGDVTSIASNQAVVAFITELNASAVPRLPLVAVPRRVARSPDHKQQLTPLQLSTCPFLSL